MKLRTLLIASFAALVSASLAVFAQSPGVNNNFATVWTMVWEASSTKPTYSATQTYTPAGGATDTCALSGSATKTIRVRRVILAGVASAVVSEEVQFILRSTADTGTGLHMAGASYDSQSAAATAVAEFWTTDPVVGTVMGELSDVMMVWGNLTTGTGVSVPLMYDFGRLGSAVVLRGAAQSLAVNLNAVNYTTPRLDCTIEWTEE